MEAQVRDLSTKLASLEDENLRLQEELKSIRRDVTTLGSNRNEREREAAQMSMKIAILEQEGKVKDEQIKRSTEDLATEKEAKVCFL